jgi:hypothetical protein
MEYDYWGLGTYSGGLSHWRLDLRQWMLPNGY